MDQAQAGSPGNNPHGYSKETARQQGPVYLRVLHAQESDIEEKAREKDTNNDLAGIA